MNRTELKKFTSKGLRTFKKLIDDNYKQQPSDDLMRKVKSTLEQSELLDSSIHLDLSDEWEKSETHPTTYEFAKYLFEKVDPVFDKYNLENDEYFWAYLSAFYFPTITRKQSRLRKNDSYYLNNNRPRLRYRMSIRAWYLYYSIHQENSYSVLTGTNDTKTHVFSDVCEQVFSRWFARNSPLLAKMQGEYKLNSLKDRDLPVNNVDKYRNSLRYVIFETSQYTTTLDIHDEDLDWVEKQIFIKNRGMKHLVENRKKRAY